MQWIFFSLAVTLIAKESSTDHKNPPHPQSQQSHHESSHSKPPAVKSHAEHTPSLSRAEQQPQHKTAPTTTSHGQVREKGNPKTKEIHERRLNENKAFAHSQNSIKQNYPQATDWFSEKFFREHNHKPFFGQHHGNWYRCANWKNITSWTSYGWDYPLYYDDEGYPEEYENEDANEPAKPNGEWLPLGVFAVAKTAEQTAYSPMFVQLALGKGGTVGGSYYNAAQDKVYTLQGYISRDTQLVSWTNADNPNSPTMTCGLYNLTQDTASVQVNFPNGVHQTWKMVRVNE